MNKTTKIFSAIIAAALLTGCAADKAVSSDVGETTQTTTVSEPVQTTTTAATTTQATTTSARTTAVTEQSEPAETTATTTTAEPSDSNDSIPELDNAGETVQTSTATDRISEESEPIDDSESVDDADDTAANDPYTDPIGYAKSMMSFGFIIESIPYAPEGYQDLLDWNIDNGVYRLCMTADTDSYTTDGIPLTTNGDLTAPVKPTAEYRMPEGVSLEFTGNHETALITELPEGCFWTPERYGSENAFMDPAGNIWTNTASGVANGTGNSGEGYYSPDRDYHPSQAEIDRAIAFNQASQERWENGPTGGKEDIITDKDKEEIQNILGW